MECTRCGVDSGIRWRGGIMARNLRLKLESGSSIYLAENRDGSAVIEVSDSIGKMTVHLHLNEMERKALKAAL